MYIHRDLEQTIRKYIQTPEIVAVIGARQAGKTTLLQHIHEGLEGSSFITFEDAEIRALFDGDIKAFIEIYVRPFRYIFIDEFQYAKTGGQSLKFIHDTVKGKKIFISGSSVLELTVRTVKYLAGRILAFTLYPLNFREFLQNKDPELYGYYMKAGRSGKLNEVMVNRLNSALEEFIIYGGYPRVVLAETAEEKQEILKNIMNVYLLRDVRDVFGLTDDYKVLNLIKALSLQIGNVVFFEELSTIASQGTHAVKNNMNLLEKTYIIRLVRPFFTNKRTELVKNPKVYFHDTGLRNSVIRDFKKLRLRQDKGALYENHVLCELVKRGNDLKYWRTKSKAEVDFIVNDTVPVEVKSALSRATAGKSLFSFIEKYGPDAAYILNEYLYQNLKAGKTDIRFAYLFSEIPLP